MAKYYGNTLTHVKMRKNQKGEIKNQSLQNSKGILSWYPENEKDKVAVDLDDTWGAISDKHGHGCDANFHYYLQRSTLHGMKYIGDRYLTAIERIFWISSIVAAVLFATYFITVLYVRWGSVIISLGPDRLPITGIPFPAITVCNNNLVRKSVAERIISEGLVNEQKLLKVLCNNNNESTLDIDNNQAADWSYFKHFLINVTQPCTQLLAACQWLSNSVPCFNIFNAALTDEGICCTFNNLPKDMMFWNPKDITDLNITFPYQAVNWTPESGYPPGTPPDGFPWRPTGSGTSMGLTIVLNAEIEEYYCASTSSAGFKILLHNPAEAPKITDYGNLIPPGFEVRLAVRPKITDFTSSLRNIAIHQRKCFFADEKKLMFYKIYTPRNCAQECETRLTIERCNCSQYYMPKNSSVRICGMRDYNCYTGVKIAIEDMIDDNGTDILRKLNCDECFPGCYELGYVHDTSMATLSDKFNIREELLDGKTLKYFKKNMAIVHVFFAEKSFTRYTKGEIYGFTDFLSNTGGILGLFLGFSFLSFIEILYFLSLRIACSFWRKRKEENKSDKVYPFSP